MLLVTINISGGGADMTCHLDSFHYEIWLFLPDPFLRVCIVIGRLTPRQVLVTVTRWLPRHRTRNSLGASVKPEPDQRSGSQNIMDPKTFVLIRNLKNRTGYSNPHKSIGISKTQKKMLLKNVQCLI